jgi:flagellar biosynthesis protein FlhG
VKLVVNQVRHAGEGRTVRQQLQQVLDRYVSPALDVPIRLDLMGEIPLDSAVRDSVLRRQLMLEHLPGAPAAIAMVALATKIIG